MSTGSSSHEPGKESVRVRMVCSRVESAPKETRQAAPGVNTSPPLREEGGAEGEFEFASDDCVGIGLEDSNGLKEAKTDVKSTERNRANNKW